MQKINHIHYVLLILGLSCAPVMQTISPEHLAAALNFCQGRFNTSDQEECLVIFESKAIQTIKETAKIIAANPMAPDLARLAQLGAESAQLNKHIPALRNDEFTTEELFQKHTRSTIEILKRCNADTDATNLSTCVTNGLLDNFKAFANSPDAIKASKRPVALEFLYEGTVLSEEMVKFEIERRQANPRDISNDLVPTDLLQDFLQQIKIARANLANASRTNAHQNSTITETVVVPAEDPDSTDEATAKKNAFTPEELFQKYTRSTIKVLRRCNADTDATNLSICITNGLLNDFKAFVNSPDTIKASKSPVALEFLYKATVLSEEMVRFEIESRQANSRDTSNDLVPTDMLKELLQQIETARTNLVIAYLSNAYQNSNITQTVGVPAEGPDSTDESTDKKTENAE